MLSEVFYESRLRIYQEVDVEEIGIAFAEVQAEELRIYSDGCVQHVVT